MRKRVIYIVLFIFLNSNYLFAQTKNIAGTVLSADDGLPLVGASIILKNSSKSITTSNDGKFSLSITEAQFKEGAILINYIGFFKQEQRIGNKTNFTIRLVKENSSLNEVIVTNSYTKPKRKEEVI